MDSDMCCSDIGWSDCVSYSFLALRSLMRDDLLKGVGGISLFVFPADPLLLP